MFGQTSTWWQLQETSGLRKLPRSGIASTTGSLLDGVGRPLKHIACHWGCQSPKRWDGHDSVRIRAVTSAVSAFIPHDAEQLARVAQRPIPEYLGIPIRPR
jgi:hypothetical protein